MMSKLHDHAPTVTNPNAGGNSSRGHRPYDGISASDYGTIIRDSSGKSVPEMVPTSSLHSYSESDGGDSLSDSARSATLSRPRRSPPRCIFGSYWSSHPSHKIGVGEKITNDGGDARGGDARGGDAREDDVMARLQTVAAAVHKFAGATIAIEPKNGWDEAAVDKCHPARPPRRRILPTPPPTTAISSSLMQPRRPAWPQPPPSLQRKALSTTALPQSRRSSCLRKSRYSCSVIYETPPAPALVRNDGRVELAKSVSFYAEVSVREFAVPPGPRRSLEGWSTYFAGEGGVLCFDRRRGNRGGP